MLEAKTLTIKKSTNKSGKVVNFVPEMVEDKEVYSVVNKNNDHCGYITEDLFNFLMEQDPEEKENKALIHRAFGVNDEEKEEESLIFGKKIILDVSSTKDINDFEKIILSPVTYTKGAKPLTIKIGTFFTVQNHGKLFDINVKSDLILGNVSIKNSKLTNISDLHDSEIANTEVLNFTLKTKNPVANKTIFSFGPMMDHAQKGYDENKNREAFCSLKNTVVKLNETDFFKNDTSGPLHLINSVVEGTTTIKTSRDEGSYSLTIDSSILNNAQIFLTREDNIGQDVATTISTSEISTFFRANGLKAVRNSIITNGDFNQIDEINDSVCESVSLDGKDNKILNGYNSVDEKESTNMGQAINDLEIL